MKLEISNEAICSVLKPYNFTPIDIISIHPRIEVGDFRCCALTLVTNKVVVIAEGTIMVYNSLTDFYSGYEPLAMATDETIHYDQGLERLEFSIIPTVAPQIDSEAFKSVRQLMFNARYSRLRELPDEDVPVE